MKLVVGIDPGLSGAIAFFDPTSGELEVVDMPVLASGTGGKKVVNEDGLAGIFDKKSPHIRHVFLEQVGAMPGQGVTSMFSFGTTYGVIRGVLASHFLRRTMVTPQKWKKALGVPAAKDGARARASQLLPTHGSLWSRVKDDGRAEASLIAYYGSLQEGIFS
jgi:crossover junction endodeoxyribonuclease RuvC